MSRRWRAVGAGLALSLAAAGCVTYVVEPDPITLDADQASPVSIPLHAEGQNPEERLVADYHHGVVAQLQDALAGRDLPLLQALIEQHDRTRSPDWFKDHLAGFRRRAAALEFELFAASIAELRTLTADAAVGEMLAFELQIRSATRADLIVPGVDGEAEPARFLCTVAVADVDCYGNRTERRSAELVTLERTARIGAGEPLVQAFGVPALAAAGCLRRVTVAIDWMPGNILLADGPAPHGRTRLATGDFEFYPGGIETLRENPYTNLRNALASGDPRYLDNLFLAARFMPEEYREDAMQKLIQGVRVGRADVVRACTAALAQLTGEGPPIGDRDAWLAWWASRMTAR